MTEQELRADIWKRAAVLIDRAKEIQAASQYGPLDEALDAVESKADTILGEAADLSMDVSAWRWQQQREKNS